MSDTDLTCDEFSGSAFEVGDSYGSQGTPLPAAVAACEGHLGRAMTDAERDQFNFGWYYGRADYEARVEREAAAGWEPEAVLPPVDGETIPF